MNKDARIYVAGHRGLVGNAITLRLHQAGFCNVFTARRDQVDLLQQDEVDGWFRYCKPEYVFLAAAKVGGIVAHTEKPLPSRRVKKRGQRLFVSRQPIKFSGEYFHKG